MVRTSQKGRNIFRNKSGFFPSSRELKCYAITGTLYGCGWWEMCLEKEERLEAAEMWLHKRILRIPWTVHVTKEEDLRPSPQKRTLILRIRK